MHDRLEQIFKGSEAHDFDIHYTKTGSWWHEHPDFAESGQQKTQNSLVPVLTGFCLPCGGKVGLLSETEKTTYSVVLCLCVHVRGSMINEKIIALL